MHRCDIINKLMIVVASQKRERKKKVLRTQKLRSPLPKIQSDERFSPFSAKQIMVVFLHRKADYGVIKGSLPSV